MRTSFVVLVPVKSLDRGKSRLAGIPDADRRALAVAFALDTLTAARDTPGVAAVVAVSGDDEAVAAAWQLGCSSLPDTGDLNGSLRAAAVRVDDLVPGGHPVALCADLPGLDAPALGRALAIVDASSAWFVPDHLGIGTTMYAAPAARFDPRFGGGSNAAHLRAGAREITVDSDRLRRDVDTLEDLTALADLGLLGAHTRRAWASTTTT